MVDEGAAAAGGQAQRARSPLQTPSQRGLLASRREHEEHGGKELSLVVAEHINYSNLAAAGTLRWRHFFLSPVKALHRIREAMEERSLQTPSSFSSSNPSSLREGVHLPLVGGIKWEDMRKSMKAWVRNPKNVALLVWGLAVGISGAMLFLIMVGFLDHAIKKKSDRDAWFEANNQILNALFALMCLYLHPQRLLHLYLLYRWEPADIKRLREVYCKDGAYKPHEWSSMLVVVLLLNLNCFAQYALCGLNWGYRRADRPALGVGLCLAVAMGAPAAAGIYIILSPLGKDYVEDEEHLVAREESENILEKKLNNKPSVKIGRAWKLSCKSSFVSRDGMLVKQPTWKGGLFDIRSDPQVTWITSLCGFCVFGWNMERLGFGNRFVHIVTFMLLCTAPYWIFFLAATNIDNSYVRHGLSYGGIVLCVFGLLYGGFWRIQMRKTFGLPAQTWCFGNAGLTDCFQWLFCSLCSLCQEVRTSEAYKIYNSKFYERSKSDLPVNGSTSQVPSPLNPLPSTPSPRSPSPLDQDPAATVVTPPPITMCAREIHTEMSSIPEILHEHSGVESPPPPAAMGIVKG